MTTTLLMSTYNAPLRMRQCLWSVLRQTLLPSEVIVADDGSTDETRQVIDSFRPLFPIPLIHVWHEDRGFRLAAIRNKAIAQAKGEYIIQIDGDVILEKHFIADHLWFSKQGCFSLGSRSLLTEEVTREIQTQNEAFEPNIFSPGLKRRDSALRCPILTPLFFSSRHTIGCNMAFWRSDLLKVNGYDEKFEGYGHEDRELCLRLMLAGKQRRKLRYAALQYHLWHPEQPRTNMQYNESLTARRKEHGGYWTENGIVKANHQSSLR